MREPDLVLRETEYRDRLDLRQQLALRPMDLQAALLRHRPQIVHFSGHGDESGIYLEDSAGLMKPVQGATLARILKTFKKQIRCVILCACNTEPVAEEIAQDIDFVVGMSESIKNSNAARFGLGFYQALAYGQSVQAAFELGCAQVDLTGVPQGSIPRLFALRENPEEAFFIEAE